MSKLSPYRRGNPYKKEISPLPKSFDNPPPYNEKDRSNKIVNNYTKAKNMNDDTGYNYKPTQKKSYDHVNNYDIDILLEKNNSLAKENAQLYQMLEERGRIVVALEKKLQEQIYREVNTLEAIEYQKKKFIGDSHKRFKEYERIIEDLKKEIYTLSEQNYQSNIMKVHQIERFKQNFTKQQLLKMNEATSTHISEATKLQRTKTKNLLEIKNNQIDDLSCKYQNYIEDLKNQIIALNGEIYQINQIRKIQVSEQKIIYEHMIDNQAKQNAKVIQVMNTEHQMLINKLQQLLAAKQIQNNRIQEQKQIGEINQTVREQELIQNKEKLEGQIKSTEEFYKRRSFKETQQLKQLNKNEIQALEVGNEAINNNLKDEITKLINLNEAKTNEINKLYDEMLANRQQSNESINNLELIIKELKERIKQVQNDYCLEEQQTKIKLATLNEADITTLKQYYQHELEVIQHQLIEKTKLADNNKKHLYQELQEKNDLRKLFDLETLKLNTRISELEHQADQLNLKRREEGTSMNSAMNMTSSKLFRQSLDKQKVHQNNEEEKKKLQQLITVKDKEIQELNQKIRLMKQNYQRQIDQKNAQIVIIKKHKQDLELQLKKQKFFYMNELKSKESIIKNDKDTHEDEINIIKKKFRDQYDSATAQATTKITALQLEINILKASEKNLKLEIQSLKHSASTELGDKHDQLLGQKDRNERQKKSLEERLKKYYEQQVQKLQDEIVELRKQLTFKEEDIRNMTEEYHKLEQKMEKVMQSQDKLRNIEERIINLGQENNLVKNFSQIVKEKLKQ